MEFMCDWCRRVPVEYIGQVCSRKCHEEWNAAQRGKEEQRRRADDEREARERAAEASRLQGEREFAEAELARSQTEAIRARTEAETRAAQTRAAAEADAVRTRAQGEAAAARRRAETAARLAEEAAQSEERRREQAHYAALGPEGRKALAQRAKASADRKAVYRIFDVLGDAEALLDQLDRLPSPDALGEDAIAEAARKAQALRPQLVDMRTELGAIQYWEAGKEREAVEDAFAGAIDRIDEWERTFEAVREARRAERLEASARAAAERVLAGSRAATSLRAGDARRQLEAAHRLATTARDVLTLERKWVVSEAERLQRWEREYRADNNGPRWAIVRLFDKSSASSYAEKLKEFEHQRARVAEAEPDVAEELRKAEENAAATPELAASGDAGAEMERHLLAALGLEAAPDEERTAALKAVVGVPCGAGTWFPEADGTTYHRQGTRRRREVTLTRSYTLGAVSVPQVLWEAVTGTNPSAFKGSLRPVEGVSWLDAVRFCNALSERLGLEAVYRVGDGDAPDVRWNKDARGFRLPTEAEWDWVQFRDSHADLPNKNSSPDPDFYRNELRRKRSWHKENAGGRTHPVGQAAPNAWGFHDLHGNVHEWVWDARGPTREGPTVDPSGPADGEMRLQLGGCCLDEIGEELRRQANMTLRVSPKGHVFGLRIARTL
jgi:formylglycine-generating enzyme required for sulfatase activity